MAMLATPIIGFIVGAGGYMSLAVLKDTYTGKMPGPASAGYFIAAITGATVLGLTVMSRKQGYLAEQKTARVRTMSGKPVSETLRKLKQDKNLSAKDARTRKEIKAEGELEYEGNCSWCKKPSVKVREVEYGGGGSICPNCHHSYRKLGYNPHKPPHPFKKRAESVMDLKSKAPATVYGKPVYGVLVNDDGWVKYMDNGFHIGEDGSYDESIQASVDFLNRPGAKYDGTNVKFIRFDDGVIFSDMQFSWASEEGSAPVQDPMEFGEMANWTPLDGTPSLRKRKRAEGMTVGVNLEALEPTPDEPESGESMVPADSLMPEGSGHVIGSQSTSHNYTPFHAEGQKYPCDSCNKMVSRSDLKVMMGSYDEDYQVCQDCLTYDAETEVHDAESFIAYPELKDHLVSIMPNKVYDIVELDDGDFEMKVASRNMDEVIATVSEYQIKEKSDSDFAFGKSKTTVAVAAAGVALMGAWLWNKRK